MGQLACRSGLSRAQFSKLFTQFTGRSPARYLLGQRIAWSARLLQTTDDGIEEIAMRCGFSDRFQFSHAFRRVMNGTPAGYRRTGQALLRIPSP